MYLRWLAVCALCALLARAAAAREGEGEDARDDSVPDALDDDDSDIALHEEESRNVHPRAYQAGGGGAGAYNALPSGFRAASLADLAGYTRPAPHQPAQRQEVEGRPRLQANRDLADRAAERAVERAAERGRERERVRDEAETEEEREEPDRLAQLLQQSRFDCGGKQTGYYADQELNCEVFHYCQDSVKHSWICPDGFTFHQVHLICMPPTQENICQKSAKYHFVNEYLYRPVNEEEVQRKPSLPLRYSERYYPAEVYHDDRADEDDDDRQEVEEVRRPAASAGVTSGPGQVFRSPEEVNIPLLQRRPQRPYEFRF